MAAFVDSHAHLADPAFDGDREQAIARARATGARGIVCIGESPDAADAAAALARRHRGLVLHTAGVHPHIAASFDATRDMPRLEAHLVDGAVAVGECGLDYHYDNSPRDVQRRVFGMQLELAARTGRPVVVHTRDAVADTIAMISQARSTGVRGVLHCFTGPGPLADAALDAGWYISFSGVVTFRKWTEDDLIRMVPANRLLVESDAPYLAPVPHRGRRNEPAFVGFTLARVAAARGVSPDALGEQVSGNASQLFGLATIDPPSQCGELEGRCHSEPRQR
jgi:TatD DNase family protein